MGHFLIPKRLASATQARKDADPARTELQKWFSIARRVRPKVEKKPVEPEKEEDDLLSTLLGGFEDDDEDDGLGDTMSL